MKIKFINILKTDEKLKMQIRHWRNSEDVKRCMYSDYNISEDEHKKWLDSLVDNYKQQVFIVFYAGHPVGVVSLNNINTRHKTSDWGFYLYHKEMPPIGVVVEYKLIDYAFNTLKLDKLNCGVLETNSAIIKLHEKFGFKKEGIRRKSIIKNNEKVDVILLGLLREEWLEVKSKIKNLIDRIG